MQIRRSGTQPSSRGMSEFFSGPVRIDPLFEAPLPARVTSVSVTFEPGSHTAWQSHSLGQTLIITSGFGVAQSEGEDPFGIRPGDVIWCAPGEKHWHGASRDTGMTHIAIVESIDGRAVQWMEKVTDEHYQAAAQMAKERRRNVVPPQPKYGRS
ncbi:MAG TPA: cupin domain-containing protein [Steroidobacteraceae bacterium]|nr:cupin domain-containing protein [Steroidobacteraceae bacterium]